MARTERNIILLHTFTIANGAAVSGVLEGEDLSPEIRSLLLVAPQTIDDATGIEVQIRDGSDNWVVLQDPPGTDIQLAQAKAIGFGTKPFPAIRLATVGGGNETAERKFELYGERA